MTVRFCSADVPEHNNGKRRRLAATIRGRAMFPAIVKLQYCDHLKVKATPHNVPYVQTQIDRTCYHARISLETTACGPAIVPPEKKHSNTHMQRLYHGAPVHPPHCTLFSRRGSRRPDQAPVCGDTYADRESRK